MGSGNQSCRATHCFLPPTIRRLPTTTATSLVERTRPFPFEPRTAIVLALAGIPMVPLLATVMPPQEIFELLLKGHSTQMAVPARASVVRVARKSQARYGQRRSRDRGAHVCGCRSSLSTLHGISGVGCLGGCAHLFPDRQRCGSVRAELRLASLRISGVRERTN